MTTIHLTGKEPLIQQIARIVGYSGRTISLETRETVDATCGNYWSEGSRNTYTFINLGTMSAVSAPDQSAFDRKVNGLDSVKLVPGIICAKEVIFRSIHSLVVYVSPDGMNPALLPPKGPDLSDDERTVLKFTRGYKSTYGGVKNLRFVEANRQTGITAESWEAAKTSCISKGYLNKAGAITVAGRNAIGS